MERHEYTLHSPGPSRAPVIDYARELNEQQYAAVTALPGPLLIIAGAGSGKTRTLTYRVAYLVENGIDPENILLLTFTNKSAKEMLHRVGSLLPHDISRMWGGTFHHVGNRILRRHAALIGYQPDFTILDRDDSKDLINACLADAKIDTKKDKFPKGDVLMEIWSYALNTRKTIRQVMAEQYGYFEEIEARIEALYPVYQERKRRSNSMDYDDLLTNQIRLFTDHPDILARYQRQFQYVLVDEYQDTNAVQSEIIDFISRAHGNLMVVGDDAQSIYSWRGANYANIMKFSDRYPGAQIHKIEINYRSTPEILNLANAAIKPNTQQYEKELKSVRKSSLRPVVIPMNDSSQQAQFVAQRAMELRDEGVALKDIAILYRSHFHAMELQMELTRRQIPFSITSGLRFFEQAHVKDVAAYLKVVLNPSDEISFRRVLKMLPGIGEKTADRIWNLVSAGVRPGAGDLLADDQNTSQFWVNLKSAKVGDSVPVKAYRQWSQLVHTFQELNADGVRGNTPEMIKRVLEACYDDYLKEHFTNYQSRLEDISQLAAFSRNFESTAEFLSQLSLLTNADAEAAEAAQEEEDRLRLTTVHQAKGLEWPVVFIIGLADGMFPNQKAVEASLEGEEEERRLFYVAVTRARDELYLTYPVLRQTASYSDMLQRPSRFLEDLPRGLFDEWRINTGYTRGRA
ncbi:MAG: ATP-dependent helicase [Verrucomicrobiae bacterium]|nr:ATP-dependent helicase [Verrucomicrobiae bacterium]